MVLRRTAALAIGVILACPGQVDIQPRPKRPDNQEKQQPTVRVDTNLVLVPVSVSDPMNRTVTGLEKGNFQLFDNGVEQTISQFARDDEPIAVGFVFDASGSMRAKLNRSRLAAKEFFNTSNPQDEFFLVEFDSSPRLLVPLTRDIGEIEDQVLFSRSRGSTALLDAVLLALGEIRKSTKNKKALLLISDGGENNSRYSEGEVRNVLRESDVLIYAMGVFGGGRTPEEMSGPALLTEIAEQTGGRMLSTGWAEIPDIAKAISLELRNRYVLGFSPRNLQRDGRYHRLQVKIISPRGMPRLRAHWRTGYYAPMN
jgi:Ca-activated chloride channel family protein